MPRGRGGKRVSRGVTEMKKVSSGYFHPPKKGIVESFRFHLSAPLVDTEDIFREIDEENLYKGYSVGNDDIVFNVKVITTTEDLSVQLIRVSQKYDTVHLVNCQVIVDTDSIDRSGAQMGPLNFTPESFKIGERFSSTFVSEVWPWGNNDGYGGTWDIEEASDQPNITIEGSILYEEPPLKMQKHISTLFNNEENSDVKICVGAEGKKVYVAHKCILSARCSFFQAMFSSNMRESTENIVNLPEESPEVFEQALHYIYTDACPDISKMPVDLLILADKYDVKDLRELCEQEIIKTMNTENVCDYLVKCEMINGKEIFDKCFRFLRKHKETVTTTVGWNKLKEMSESKTFLSDVIKEIEK